MNKQTMKVWAVTILVLLVTIGAVNAQSGEWIAAQDNGEFKLEVNAKHYKRANTWAEFWIKIRAGAYNQEYYEGAYLFKFQLVSTCKQRPQRVKVKSIKLGVWSADPDIDQYISSDSLIGRTAREVCGWDYKR